jgi:dipeptidyl aminopeptidase/acylaminoacyl peptidase
VSTAVDQRPLSIEDLVELHGVSDVNVSADGQRIACVVSQGSAAKGELPQSRIWISTGGAPAQQATRGPGRDALPRFSPDGRSLAFTSDRDRPGLAGLYLLQDGAEAQPLGEIAGLVEQVVWSQKGDRLLVLAADPGADLAGAQTGVKVTSEETDVVVERPGKAWRRLWMVDVASGETREVSPEGLNVWEVGWNGDGPAVAIVSDDPSESAWYVARLALLDLDARTATDVYTPEWQLQSPVLSPDGRHVAFVEGFNSDRTGVAGTTTVVELASRNARTLAADKDIMTLQWLCADELLGVGVSGLGTICVRISLDGVLATVWSGPATLGQTHDIHADCDASGETIAAVLSASGRPPELAVLRTGQGAVDWEPLSTVNAAFVGRVVPRTEPYSWTARDGQQIEGVLLLPPDTDGPLPLVVIVHGGPTTAWTFEFDPGYLHHGLALGNAGYAVLMPNPRGSTGRGPQFAQANIGDMGGEDLQDILCGVRSLVADGIVDEKRVGITGGSYGGFMSAWAITQTGAFAASVPISCVSNWLSFHNTTNIGRFDSLFLQGDPYEPDGAYYQRSPVVHVRNCKTPTLILHGELDLCTPLGQAQEMYRGLVDVGVETELVIYPRGGHGWWERDHLIDSFERIKAWFDKHLSSEPGSDQVPVAVGQATA